jgi:hypothetical protein
MIWRSNTRQALSLVGIVSSPDAKRQLRVLSKINDS